MDFSCRFLKIFGFFRELLQLFIAAELIHWGQLCQQYEHVLRQGDEKSPLTSVFTIGKQAFFLF